MQWQCWKRGPPELQHCARHGRDVFLLPPIIHAVGNTQDSRSQGLITKHRICDGFQIAVRIGQEDDQLSGGRTDDRSLWPASLFTSR